MADRSASRGDYVLLGLASLGYACLTFVWFSAAAFLPLLATDLGLSGTEAGLLTGIIPLVYVPFSLASGLVIDRVGSRTAIAVGMSLFGVAQLARGFAPDFPVLLTLTAIVGIGGTGITFGLPKLVAERFPPARSGTMSSVYLLGSYLGIAAAFGLGRAVLGPVLGGWRPVFRLSGLVVLTFALVWAVAARRLTHQRDEQGDNRGDDRGSEKSDGASGEGGNGGDSDPRFDIGSLVADVKRVSSHPEMRLLIVIGSMYLLLLHGLQNWLAAVLEARGFDPALAAGMATLLVLARALGTITIPPLSDAFSHRRGAVIGCGALAGLGTLGVLFSGTALLLTGAVVVLIGVGLGGLGPLVRALPIEFDGIGPEFTGTAVGLVFAVGELGGFLGPFLVGTLRDLTGSFAIGLSVFVLASLVISLAGYAMAEPGEREST